LCILCVSCGKYFNHNGHKDFHKEHKGKCQDFGVRQYKISIKIKNFQKNWLGKNSFGIMKAEVAARRCRSTVFFLPICIIIERTEIP